MQPYQKEIINKRIGLHYFPDTLHYRMEDLKTWLPVFKKLEIGWLVLRSDTDRAIPEFFLRSLLQANISPIIQFTHSFSEPPNVKESRILLQVYARWGVRYVIFFDRPNQKSVWPSTGWSQKDLVDRFLDLYIPMAHTALAEGLIPVLPPLEPGGSYWDTAFLRGTIQGLLRRKQEYILNNLVFSAYGHTNEHDLTWGIGGPERWPQSRPYLTPKDSQDQCGFRIFEWYQKISHALLQKDTPIILLQAGMPSFPEKVKNPQRSQPEIWKDQSEIIRLVQNSQMKKKAHAAESEVIPEYVLSCNFWLLSAEDKTLDFHLGWYQREQPISPCIQALVSPELTEVEEGDENCFQLELEKDTHPINHYVLLPVYEWGVADWHLEVIAPYVKKHKATFGFCPGEAKLARLVTVIGNPQSISEEVVADIRRAGSIVERICGDGTSIATQLSER